MTSKQEKTILDAVGKGLKDAKPRPAVDKVLTARLTGKWTHYAQILLAYSPKEFGIVYVNLDKPSEPTVKIHGPETKQGKFATAKELRRLAKAEKRVAGKAKIAAKS
jgi:hypothetical protein